MLEIAIPQCTAILGVGHFSLGSSTALIIPRDKEDPHTPKPGYWCIGCTNIAERFCFSFPICASPLTTLSRKETGADNDHVATNDVRHVSQSTRSGRWCAPSQLPFHRAYARAGSLRGTPSDHARLSPAPRLFVISRRRSLPNPRSEHQGFSVLSLSASCPQRVPQRADWSHRGGVRS